MVPITNVGVSSPKASKKLIDFGFLPWYQLPTWVLIHPRLLGPAFDQSMQDF